MILGLKRRLRAVGGVRLVRALSAIIFGMGLAASTQALASDCLSKGQGAAVAVKHRPHRIVHHHRVYRTHAATKHRSGVRKARAVSPKQAPKLATDASRAEPMPRHPLLSPQLACDTASVPRLMSLMSSKNADAPAGPSYGMAASPMGEDASASAGAQPSADLENPAPELRPPSPQTEPAAQAGAVWGSVGVGGTSSIETLLLGATSGLGSSGTGVQRPAVDIATLADPTVVGPLPSDPAQAQEVIPGLAGQGAIATSPISAPPSLGPKSGPIPMAAVPEPKTWVMLLLGFGNVGVVLRSRRQARVGPV